MRTPHQWTQEILNTLPVAMTHVQAYKLKEFIMRIQVEAVIEGRRRSTENILREYPTLNARKIRQAAACDPTEVKHADPLHR